MLTPLILPLIEWQSSLTISSTLLATVGGAEGEGSTKILAVAVTLTIIAVFITAQIFGELATRIGLPTVLGELLAGLLLGVSGLQILMLNDGTAVAPWYLEMVEWTSGGDRTAVLEAFNVPVRTLINDYAEFGVGVLLFKIGLEADLKELIKVGPQATTVAIVGVFLPLIAGFLGLTTVFHLDTIPALFGAAALTATSIGITSRIMQDLGVLQTKEGQIILGAAVLDDILGIAILAIAVGIANHGTVEVTNILSIIVSAVLFVAAAIALNKFFGPIYINILERLNNRHSVLVGAMIFLAVMAIFAQAIGLESILGCFAAGVVLGDTKATHALEEACEPLVALFATIFFVTIGAKTDLTFLNLANPDSRTGLVIAVFLTVIAIVTKIAAGYGIFTSEKVDRLAIGTGMVPRGEVGLVFAGLGTATGALSDSLNVAIVLMVIATTFVAPPMLRWVFSRTSKRI